MTSVPGPAPIERIPRPLTATLPVLVKTVIGGNESRPTERRASRAAFRYLEVSVPSKKGIGAPHLIAGFCAVSPSVSFSVLKRSILVIRQNTKIARSISAGLVDVSLRIMLVLK